MIDLATVGTVMSGIKATGQLAKKAFDSAVDNKAKESLREIMDHLMGVQSSTLELQSEMSELMAENDRLKREAANTDEWTSFAKDFELVDMAGGWVYARKDKTGPWYCQTCFDKKIKSVLQPDEPGSTYFKCKDCGFDMLSKPNPRFPQDPGFSHPDSNYKGGSY